MGNQAANVNKIARVIAVNINMVFKFIFFLTCNYLINIIVDVFNLALAIS